MNRFTLIVSAILAAGYAYVALRLGSAVWDRAALAVPFVLIWVVPAVYWSRDREDHGRFDELVHVASYLSMAWVSFLVVMALARDLVMIATAVAADSSAHRFVAGSGVPLVYAGSLLALVVGALVALRGPTITRVDVPVPDLHPDLEGLRIAQVSDLHVGLTIRRGYVQRVAALADSLDADFVALTGDLVDGSVEALAEHVEPLRALRAPAYFILGNHDCYSGAAQWIAHFRAMGMRVLLNEGEPVRHGAATVWVGGVVDPAARFSDTPLSPRADLAAEGAAGADFRVLLAHNPKLARAVAQAGFDLQLSGHTHAGQFFPWTLAVKLVHAPHVAGLSREGRMWVYVSPGTGTWGPPVRFGTKPELTLLTLVKAPERASRSG